MGSKMARRKKKDDLFDDLGRVATVGVGLAVGAGISGAIGAPSGVTRSFGTAASFIGPVVGLVVLKHARKQFKSKDPFKTKAYQRGRLF